MSESIREHLKRRLRWSTTLIYVGLVLAFGSTILLWAVRGVAATLLHTQLHYPSGTGAILGVAGIASVVYAMLLRSSLKCPVCGKALALGNPLDFVSDDEDDDNVPGFCPSCDTNWHKPMPQSPSSPIT
jgi:hypothetical protein